MRIGLSFLILIFQCSCSNNSDADKRDSAIREALIFLSTRECAKAKVSLDEVGVNAFHADYLSALASVDACFAGYSEINLFANDLVGVSFSDANFFGPLATFSSSTLSGANDSSYRSLLSAIETLAYAGLVTVPLHANRLSVFPARDVANMNAQLLYMQLVQLGKYVNYYGDGVGTAIKGSGGNNTCFFSYSSNYALSLIHI